MTELSISRRAELQRRCELQRGELATQIAAIEARLHSTDSMLGSLRSVMTRPALLAGGAALLMTVGRSGWWSTLSRAVILLGAARRLYSAFKRA